MRRHFTILLATWLLCFASNLSAVRKEPILGAEIIGRLIEPSTRLAALREIEIAKQSEDSVYDWSELSVAAFETYHRDVHVVKCDQPENADPVYLVFYRPDFNAFYQMKYSAIEGMVSGHTTFDPVISDHVPEEIRERSRRNDSKWKSSSESPHLSVFPKGPLFNYVFVTLTSEGQVIWPFEGNNVADGDIFADIDGDGYIERIHTTNYGVYDESEGDPNIKVQSLQVTEVGSTGRKEFHLVLNWHHYSRDEDEEWAWRLRFADTEALPEIAIGPVSDDEMGLKTKAVYRWSAGEGGYVGPAGGQDDHYMVINHETEVWDELQRVKEAGGLAYAMDPAVELGLEEAPAKVPLTERPEWETRERYQHQSLLGSSDSDLLYFMTGTRPLSDENEEAKAADASHRRFEFNTDWFEKSPKEAALTAVEANQSLKHRGQYDLFYPTNATAPPVLHWAAFTTLGQKQFVVLRADGEMVMAEHRRSVIERYPGGEYTWDWSHGKIEPERSAWLMETMWWLAQLRTWKKQDDRVRRTYGYYDRFAAPPSHQIEKPSVQMYDLNGHLVLDVGSKQIAHGPQSWSDHYDQNVYAGIAGALLGAWCKEIGRRKFKEINVVTLVEEYLPNREQIQKSEVPPQLMRKIVQSAGDLAKAELLPSLAGLAAALPSPSEAELRIAELERDIEALEKERSVDAFKEQAILAEEKHELELQLRKSPALWLRDDLDMALRQLDHANDIGALTTWADDPDDPGALWALNRLKQINEEAYLNVLFRVFRTRQPWRSRILSYINWKYNPLAGEWLLSLESNDRLPLYTVLAAKKEAADEWIVEGMMDALEATSLGDYKRLDALRKLVPSEAPNLYEYPELDQLLLQVFEEEIIEGREQSGASMLRLALGHALLIRNAKEVPFELMANLAEEERSPFSYHSVLPLMLHLAEADHSPEAQSWLLDWSRNYFDTGRGQWKEFSEFVYLAGLKAEFMPALSKLASLSPDGPTGPNSDRFNETGELQPGERYHRPRQLIAVWQEPDSFTQAKLLVLFAISSDWRGYHKKLYSLEERIANNVSDLYLSMSDSEQAQFIPFIQWCEKETRLGGTYSATQFLKRLEQALKKPG